MSAQMPYTRKVAQAVCDLLACSEASISSVLGQVKGAPKPTRWYEWLKESEECAEMYARAKEAQADYMAGQIVEIADSEPDSNRARVRVDARKWVAAKLRPRVYGDKTMHGSDPDNPLAFTVVTGIGRTPGEGNG